MATRAICLCCPFCSAFLCGCLSCTFVSLHFQNLLHGKADWMAPCSSDLLSCLGKSNRIWHDKMILQKSLPSPKSARVCPGCSPGLSPLRHSQAWAQSVLMGETTTHPQRGHRQTRLQNHPRNLCSFRQLKSEKSRFFSTLFFLFVLVWLVSVFT